MTISESYVFGEQHRTEQHRLLARAHDPMTSDRLASTGVTDGWDCLDVGCGGGSIALWLAERVAPTGTVLATDIRPGPLESRPGLRVATHDVAVDPLPEAGFDLIVARLVLRHLPQRQQVLNKLVRTLKPGGWLQVDEFDTSYEPLLLAPDEPAARLYEKFLAAKEFVMRSSGVDPKCGRRIAAAMREAGLVGIDPQPYVQVRRPGSADLELLANHTRQLRDGLLAAGMSEDELDELRDLVRAPDFRASSSVMYSVHGRKVHA